MYIDKTEYVYRMTHSGSNYLFLSRPRRFGKSLLTSTLHAYFEGRKDLFEGLAIEKLEKEWTEYAVLHFRTRTTLYVMELKLDKTAGAAMQQIDLRNYPERFALCGLPIVKVAVGFDSERHTLVDWMIIK